MKKRLPMLSVRTAYEPCACAKCRECCDYFPGYFLPQEIAPAAKLFGVSEREFRRKYLTRREGGALSPRVGGPGACGQAGFVIHGFGRCVFFDGKRCGIQGAKPFECRASYGCRPMHQGETIRAYVLRAWALEIHGAGPLFDLAAR